MRKIFAVMALSLLAAHVMAAVSPEEAAKLGTSLTPVGAEKAGNADGSIPAWTGGIPKNAGAVDSKGFLADPFANEKPLFVITAATVDKYKAKLSDGQVAMFKRYPETYKIPVYPTHRTVNLPPDIYESIKRSALNVHAINNGNGLENFTGNRYYAFPIPKNGVEVLWNHITRYHGGNLKRIITQATPQTNGSYTPIRFEEEVAVPQAIPDIDPAKAANVLSFFKQSVTAPARLAGNVLLVHETLDQVKEPRLAWIYNAGQRRVRRAPQVSYDGPGTASDGLRTTDNFDMFSGAPDRYDWKLVGKKRCTSPTTATSSTHRPSSTTTSSRPGISTRTSLVTSCTGCGKWSAPSSQASDTSTPSATCTLTRTAGKSRWWITTTAVASCGVLPKAMRSSITTTRCRPTPWKPCTTSSPGATSRWG